MKKILAITLLSLLACTSMAFAEAKIAADLELNPTFDSLSDGSTITTFDFGGRVQVTVSGKIENKDTGFFVASQTQILLKEDGTAGTDDAWGQLGNKSFSLKLGRFEAIALLDAGEDIYVANAGGTWYTAANARGRTNGGFALDFNASDNVLVEIGGVYGNTSYILPDASIVSENKFGVRPLVKITMGNIWAVAGADLYFENPRDKDVDGSTSKIGFGGQVNAKVSNITVNVGAAFVDNETKDYAGFTDKIKQKVTTIKGYVNIPVGENLVGLGAGYSNEDLNDTKETYGFAVYEYKLPVEGAWLKFAASYAKVQDGDSDVGGRVRFAYNF